MSRKLLASVVLIGAYFGSCPEAALVAIAQDGACTAGCRAQYAQCRIATKGSPSCDAQFAACMRSCINSRGR